MKKLITFLGAFVLVMALFFTTTAEANSFREVKVVSGSSLVVKEKATTSSTTVATLKKGDLVTIFSTTNGWAYMQSGTTKGYVAAAHLAVPNSTIKIASSKSGLVVKESASKTAKTVAVLQYNMIVEDFGTIGAGWSFVQYGNVTGYVASTFIGTPKTTSKTTKEAVSVRNIASPSGAVKSSVAAGTKVTVHSTIAGWSFISNGTKRGYVEAAKLMTPKTITTAYAKDYLPACPKTYTFKSTTVENGYSSTDYSTSKCKFYNSGRWIEDPTDEYGLSMSYYTLKGSEIHVGYYEGSSVYKFPLTVGKSWSYDFYVEDSRTKYVMGLNEVVTTPAGTFFNVIKIRETTEYGTSYEYIAPYVGTVKTDFSYNFYGEKISGTSELYSMY